MIAGMSALSAGGLALSAMSGVAAAALQLEVMVALDRIQQSVGGLQARLRNDDCYLRNSGVMLRWAQVDS